MHDVMKKAVKWPISLASYIIVLTAVYFAVRALGKDPFWTALILAAGCLLFALLWFYFLKKTLEASIMKLAMESGDNLASKMELLALPYVLISTKGEILWSNENFRQILASYGSENDQRAKLLGDIFPELAGEHTMRTSEPEYVRLGERTFRVNISRVSRNVPVSALLLSDETVHLQTLQELEDEKNVAGLIYIDNYEEVIKSTGAENQGFLSVILEQKIQRYFQRFDGIAFTLQKDHFFVSLNNKALQAIREDRFSLLEDVKSVKAGNETPVTVSMAFGFDCGSYEANMEQARTAIDLALGRGGDQAIMKSKTGVEYFGGKSIGEASKTRVKARVKAQALRELLSSSDQVFLMGHPNGDNDSFGACVALFRAAEFLEKKTHIIMDDVSFSVRPLADRFSQSSEYPEDLFVSSRRALGLIGDNAIVVVVDSNRADYTECPEILKKARSVVVFDHHRQMAEAIPATLSYVEPYASSACELTTEILQYFDEKLKLRPLEAEAIYAGILVDTNNFTDRTGVRTFDAAAYLKRSGADLIHVKKALREDYGNYMAKAEALRSAEIYKDCYAFAVCKSDGLDSPNVVGAQAANELLNIVSVKASFVFTEVNGIVYISARSIDELNVQLVMERIGGGGHLSVAGAQLKGVSVGEAIETVKAALTAMMEEGAV